MTKGPLDQELFELEVMQDASKLVAKAGEWGWSDERLALACKLIYDTNQALKESRKRKEAGRSADS